MNKVILELTRIVQEVALVESPSEQVRRIVDSISHVIGVDVCSLYRMADDGDMILLATHGLASSHPIRVPAGKGLVGRVATSRHPLNVADAAGHPDFYYIAETLEERFSSFCGVPLVRFGEVIGVLVVQSRRPEKINDESEAFLVTLASQLAFIVADISPLMTLISNVNQRIVGVKGSPGIGIGQVQLCHHGGLNDVPDATCEDIEGSVAQWHSLLAAVKEEVKEEQAALGVELSESVTGIFEAYQMLLADQSLTDKVVMEIRAGHWLPAALRMSIHYFAELFRAMDDPYLKARHEDIQHLGNKLFNVWRGVNPVEQMALPDDHPVVLVGPQISVSDMASFPAGSLAGVVCFEGAKLSHTAVLANAMGIPAVMGVGGLKGLKSGEEIIVDGNEGQVILHPNDTVLHEFNQLVTQALSFQHKLDELRNVPAKTQDGIQVRLLANTGLLADITPGIRNGAEGVGLYRTEIPFIVRDSFPTEDEQVQVYGKVFDAYEGKPVYVRVLDVGGDKQLPYFPIHGEENPALGWRGIRFTLDNVQLLMTQVRAIIRAARGQENLHILLPMVSSTAEVETFRRLLDDACAELQEEGLELIYPKLGVMVEVPAAISQLRFWRDKIDFVS
ncbi:MAG: PEP-utilizing enzyme, partial [Pseudomonadales bacterium]|nr:PEP-utilizing enzyme [Pseudomonadales bacterium]